MKTITRNSRNYQPGTASFDLPSALEKRFVAVGYRFTRENWPAGVDYTLPDGTVVPNTALVVAARRTFDGQTWELLSRSTYPGGVLLHPRTGEVVPTCGSTVSYTAADGSPFPKDGDVRIEVTVLVPIRTALTLTLYEPGDTWQ